MHVVKAGLPIPELKPDKALIVAVCPTPSARAAGKGNQIKLHANDHVIAVNKVGTYTLAYLDPREYLFVSQAENANGFSMKVEAGKDYYFLQDLLMGVWKGRSNLSRHSREFGIFQASGAYYSDWKRKNP